MYIFAEPVTEEQVNIIQSQNAAKIQEFERKILGRNQIKAEDQKDGQDDPEWDDIQANVQSAMDEDEFGLVKVTDEREGNKHHLGENLAGRAEDIESHVENPTAYELAREAPLIINNEGEREDEDPEIVKEEDEASQDESEDRESKKDGVMGQDDEHLRIENHVATGETGNEGSALNQNTSTKTKVRAARPKPSKSVANTRRRRRLRIRRHLSYGKVVRYIEFGEGSNTTVPLEGEKNLETQADKPFLKEIGEIGKGAEPAQEILAMTLTLRNKVNESFVLRPENFTAADKWSIEYSLVDVPDQNRAWALYEACRARRRKKLDAPTPAEDEAKVNYYVRNLRKLSEKGRRWREEMDDKDKERPVSILGAGDELAEAKRVLET